MGRSGEYVRPEVVKASWSEGTQEQNVKIEGPSSGPPDTGLWTQNTVCILSGRLDMGRERNHKLGAGDEEITQKLTVMAYSHNPSS